MKSLKFILPLLAGLIMTACSEDTKIMVTSNPTAPVLGTLSQKFPSYNKDSLGYVLNKDSAAKTVEVFAATPADFGVTTVPTYTLEVAKAGTNFANVAEVGTSSNPTMTVTVGQLNTPIASEGQLNATPYKTASFDIRIKTTLGNLAPLYSAVKTIKVCPYPTYGVLYVPGSYQHTYPGGGDWTPSHPNTILYSSANNSIYDGFLDMSGGANFKFTEQPNWDHAFGAGSSAGTISATGGDISAAAGYYHFTVDFKQLTYTKTAVTSFGVIGAAGNWGTETKMTFDATTKLWTAANVVFNAGDGFKIRMNESWDTAFGLKNGKYVLSNNADNISIPSAGTYDIVLDVRQFGKPGYQVIMTKK